MDFPSPLDSLPEPQRRRMIAAMATLMTALAESAQDATLTRMEADFFSGSSRREMIEPMRTSAESYRKQGTRLLGMAETLDELRAVSEELLELGFE